MIDALILDAMLAAGATAEVIVAAVKADAAKDESRREARRANNAERQRRYRERHALDNEDNALPDVTERFDPSLDKSPQTPKINPTPGICVGDRPVHALARKAEKFPCPEGCEPDDWRDLLANRRSKRLPMTPAAYRKLQRDLAEQSDEEWPPGRVLAFAAERGWAAIFDPRQSNGTPRNGQRPSSGKPEPQNTMLRAAIRAEARGPSG